MFSIVLLLPQILGWGRNVFMGYLNRETETRETQTESGWLRLGDLGGTDPDGFLLVHGRSEEGDLVALRSGEVILPSKVRRGAARW